MENLTAHIVGTKLEKKKSRTWIMIGGVVLAGVVLGSVVAQTGYHVFEKQVSETQGELTARYERCTAGSEDNRGK